MKKLGGPVPHINRFQHLNSFLLAINAETLQVKGSIFTWKKWVHMHLVYEKLDRRMVRNDWSNLYPDPYELHGNFTCSDHCPIIISTHVQHEKGKAFPFRFQFFWCKY